MLSRSLTVARIAGIPIRLHVTLLLLLPYAVYATAVQTNLVAQSLGVDRAELALAPWVLGVVLAVALLVSIALHELAHSILAMRAGVRVRSITLMALGGISEMADEVPAAREAWMAAAGPAASFAIAAVSYAIAHFVPLPAAVRVSLVVLAVLNAGLGAFNLLPAFPMDGGRILRAALVPHLGQRRATSAAVLTGRVFAVAMGLFALFGQSLMLLLIAVFVYIGASAELARSRTRAALVGVPVARLMNDKLGSARQDENASEVARRLLRENHVGAKVVSDGVPAGAEDGALGVVTAWDLARGAGDATVRSVMRGDVPRVHADDDASRAIEMLATGDAPAVMVLDSSERIVGLVTSFDAQRALALLGAIGARRHPYA